MLATVFLPQKWGGHKELTIGHSVVAIGREVIAKWSSGVANIVPFMVAPTAAIKTSLQPKWSPRDPQRLLGLQGHWLQGQGHWLQGHSDCLGYKVTGDWVFFGHKWLQVVTRCSVTGALRSIVVSMLAVDC